MLSYISQSNVPELHFPCAQTTESGVQPESGLLEADGRQEASDLRLEDGKDGVQVNVLEVCRSAPAFLVPFTRLCRFSIPPDEALLHHPRMVRE